MASCFKLGAAYSFVLSVVTLSVCFSANRVLAQVTPDRTLGAESSVVNPNGVINGLPSDRIDGGAKRGANLFHSFLDFNVAAGRGVYFANPAGVGNIFSRVTGSNASTIAGKLGVLGAANLFLLNPHGIIFTASASLDIAGSFVASSAQNLLMADGTTYSATSPTSSLLTVSVPLGVQFGAGQPAAIVNNGNLTTGGNLALVGGTVVSTGQLNAPTGNVVVVTLPADSAVNLRPAGQLLSVNTPATTAPSTPSSASLVPLAQGGSAASGLTLNGNGQVALAGSGLPVVEGDVVVRQLTGQTATLSANHNLTLVESQLQTAGDLNLLAKDTVTVRDSVAAPFIASAGGQLLVQGNQAVDLFALNNATSGLFSGGDMVLRSASTVGGDAHYYAGGSFQIERLDGSAGSLYSPNDPIIRASGNVKFDSYTGLSLHILAGGSVTITGNIEITGADDTNGPDGPNGLTETLISLPDGTLKDRPSGDNTTPIEVVIDGTTTPTLDIRAGVDKAHLGPSAPTEPSLDGLGFQKGVSPETLTPTKSPDTGGTGTGSTITIGGSIINTSAGKDSTFPSNKLAGQVFLTNTYSPNNLLPSGDISVNGIDGIFVLGDVNINSRGGIAIANGIDTTSNNNVKPYLPGGNIRLIANQDITTGARDKTGKIIARGDLTSEVTAGSAPESKNFNNSGNITLLSRNGAIDTTAGAITSKVTGDGKAGDITINASGQIKTRSISSQVTGKGDGGNVTLTSNNDLIDTTAGTITSQAASGAGGKVLLFAKGNIYTQGIIASSNVNIDTTKGGTYSAISILSTDGSVFINKSQDGSVVNTGRSDDGKNNSVKLSTTNNLGLGGLIFINAGEGKNIEIASSDVSAEGAIYGEIHIGLLPLDGFGLLPSDQVIKQPLSSKVDIQDSTISTNIISTKISEDRSRDLVIPSRIQIRSREIDVNNSKITTITSSQVPPGFITLDAIGSVSVSKSEISGAISSDSGVLGKEPAITILGDSIRITDLSNIDASTDGIGKGADVILLGRNGGSVVVNESTIQTNGNSPAGGGAIQIYGGAISLNTKPINSLGKQSIVQAEGKTPSGGKAGDVKIGALTQNDIVNINKRLDENRDVSQSIPITDFGSPFSLQTLEATNSTISTSTISGAGGSISVEAKQSVSLTGGASVLAQATNGGSAGSIGITTSNLKISNPNSKISASAVGATGSSIENGRVNVTATNNLTINDGAQITAEASNGAKGGDILITTANATVTDPNSKISASATGMGSTGGKVTVTAPNLTVANGAQITASADPATPADKEGTGATAGDVRVVVDNKLTVEKGAQISVSAPLNDVGGNLYVFADKVFLKNGALSANTGKAGDGANIFLFGKGANVDPNDPNSLFFQSDALSQAVKNGETPQVINAQFGNPAIPAQNFLIMENGSQITARASGDAPGGNIFIKTQVLLATQIRNKISADAGKGTGGNIYIFAKPLGIYNIEFRSTGTTRLNDITATSLSGASGIVNLALPDINPSRGLNQLPIDLADASKEITPTCPIAGRPGAANQFVIAGRGGLPETPGSALNTSVLVGEQPAVATQPTSPDLSAATTPTPTVEAQGIRLGADGAFILTANPTSTQPYSFWQPALGCPQP